MTTALNVAKEAAAELAAVRDGSAKSAPLADAVLSSAQIGFPRSVCEKVLTAMAEWVRLPESHDQLDEEATLLFTDEEDCVCGDSDCICDEVAFDIAGACIDEAAP